MGEHAISMPMHNTIRTYTYTYIQPNTNTHTDTRIHIAWRNENVTMKVVNVDRKSMSCRKKVKRNRTKNWKLHNTKHIEHWTLNNEHEHQNMENTLFVIVLWAWAWEWKWTQNLFVHICIPCGLGRWFRSFFVHPKQNGTKT